MNFKHFSPLTDLKNLTKTLDLYGVAVLPNVFTYKECEFVKNSTLDYLAKTHGVNKPDDFAKICPMGGGILHEFGISLIKEILDMKTDERVENAFKTIWNNEEVTMSLDGINISPPTVQMQGDLKFKYEHAVGFHTDHGSEKKEKCCVQAFINLEHTEEGDGCLSVLTKSHNLHSKFFETFKISTTRDWFVIDKNHYDWFLNSGCKFF